MQLSLDQILAWQHLAVVGAAMGILEALKATLKGIGLPKDQSKIVHAILPWLPLVLCASLCAIPGVVQFKIITDSIATEPQIGLRLVFGVMLGALSGQLWKIVKTKLELLRGDIG